MTTQTVTVQEVDGPNTNGWYEVVLSDGSKASTKNEAVAKAAFQSRGNEVNAVISEVAKGSFTNRYLNEIDGVKDTFKGKRGGSKTPSASTRSPEANERIARQWAYGRATELLVGSGIEYEFPLNTDFMVAIKTQAEALLEATRE